MLSKSIFQHIIHMNFIDNNPKITIYRPGKFERGIPCCDLIQEKSEKSNG